MIQKPSPVRNAILLAAMAGTSSIAVAAGFTLEKTDSVVVVKSEGTEVLRYQLRKPAGSQLSVDSACYLHPLVTPKGTVITDAAPDDHRHHRGIFFGWRALHGKKDGDFYGWGGQAPKERRAIINKGVSDLHGGKTAKFRASNIWQAEDVTLLREELRVTVGAHGPAHTLDLVYTFTADAELTIAPWAFGGLVLRARKDNTVEAQGPEGPVTLPPPKPGKSADHASNWPAVPWYGFTLRSLSGQTASAAIIDHPRNPPSSWHNYLSIRMWNPAIVEELRLGAQKPIVLRYRVVAQDGALSRDLINDLARAWRAKP